LTRAACSGDCKADSTHLKPFEDSSLGLYDVVHMYVSVFPPPGTALDKDRHNHRPVCSTDTINVTNISF
jgi:hypothetical protein